LPGRASCRSRFGDPRFGAQCLAQPMTGLHKMVLLAWLGGGIASAQTPPPSTSVASPPGPRIPWELPEDMMTLDGTFWVEDGVPYMVYCHEWVQIVNGTVEMIRLADDLSGTVGEPT